MAQRHFSLKEARLLLPQLRELATRMVAASEELARLQPVAQALAENRNSNAGSPAGTLYVRYLIALQYQVQEIQALGCLVKGVGEGLIDFPHLRDGREVHLCWQLGEEDIDYWHEVDSGFSGRTPILDGD